MRLVEQWNGVESGLDPRWGDVQLSLRVEAEETRDRAAALLGPASPGLSGDSIRFDVTRSGGGMGPEAARRLLGRIDAEGIEGDLTLVSATAAETPPQVSRPLLAAEWEAGLEALPSDWSDLVVELELDSSTDIDRAAVLCAPLNPIQARLDASQAKPAAPGGRPGFRFRCASAHGYGASPGMVGRCLTRLDADEISGSVRIARVLSDVHPVGTQGAVFLTGRRPA